MVSRENRIILACIAVAVPLGLAVASVEGLPDWVPYLVVTVVGVFLPGYLTGRYRADGT
ncbi:hypothetical protein M0R89_00775 [Halorussus limi]|uniref:Uncharacterized protein n=1 Tax=Halorussus limi TaxID=2938695 RepID=A0A8U0HUL2_9EURY|nr:hypothetical protein [Halorussus limi]UPV74618.1 hypothetical protein M0R89_00775 [Halorussus limi]